MGERIARVFPRKTAASPDDALAFFDVPPLLDPPDVDAVHISVAFSWDIPRAEWLGKQWEMIAPVKFGGPAMGESGGDFVPGRYVKDGYVITSRGCPNRCWFCSVWKREGDSIRQLPISRGWNLLDDNLLACTDYHIKQVFQMLEDGKKQYGKRPEFTGGLEAARLCDWHVDLLLRLKPKQMFFAYDTPDDLEPLRVAGKKLLDSGFTTISHVLRAYVLVGWQKDSFDDADKRMRETMDAGFMPMAMLYRDQKGDRDPEWMRWQRKWARPALISARQSQDKYGKHDSDSEWQTEFNTFK